MIRLASRTALSVHRRVGPWTRITSVTTRSDMRPGIRHYGPITPGNTIGRCSVVSDASESEVPAPSIPVPDVCPGCGIFVQQTDSNKPGFLKMPAKAFKTPKVETVESFREEGFEHPSEIEIKGEPVEEEKEIFPVCERCYSLRHYGRLKNAIAEKQVPKFSVENALMPKIAKDKGKKVVVVCVVDLFDFTASLPQKELRSLFPPVSRLPDFLDFILVGNKADLIHKSVQKRTLEVWIRTLLNEHRLPFVKKVHLVSSHTMMGIRDLMVALRQALIQKTDCYIIGVQNAGKSSLLNALRQLVGTDCASPVTTAALPGTTLGFVQVPGFPLNKTCRMFDSPGIKKPDQITTRLTMEELKLVTPKRALKPRTYRFGPESSLLIGGLVRLDVDFSPGKTLYVTVWVSDSLTCFLGKRDGIEEKIEKHRGRRLQPPIGDDPMLPSGENFVAYPLSIEGTSWTESSVDICIGGANVCSFVAGGKCGIHVSTRPALIRPYAGKFQILGFSTSVKSGGIRTR